MGYWGYSANENDNAKQFEINLVEYMFKCATSVDDMVYTVGFVLNNDVYLNEDQREKALHFMNVALNDIGGWFNPTLRKEYLLKLQEEMKSHVSKLQQEDIEHFWKCEESFY